MSAHLAALLAGLFVVPGAALVIGHRLGRRGARARATFWGLIIGHTVAMLAAIVAAMYQPQQWSDGDLLRGALGFWGMLMGGAAGALLGALIGGRRNEAARERR